MSKYLKDFAIFILTHKRADNLKTLTTLKRCGYTGRIVIVIDDEDPQADEYFRRYQDQVVQFSKEEISKKFDQGDNFKNRKTITYARNASFEIAESLGIKYFMQLDDDYTAFSFTRDKNLRFLRKEIKNLDKVFDLMLKFYVETKSVTTIAMAQGGDFIGGEQSQNSKNVKPKRKAMNSFLCSTERPFKFIGRMNEDVNTYTTLGSRGVIFLTLTNLQLNQGQTQTNDGGITELYKEFGTYVKSMNTVMMMPSSVQLQMMGNKHKRIHHKIKWKNTVPCIVSEDYKL